MIECSTFIPFFKRVKITYTVFKNLDGKKVRVEGGVLSGATSMCMGMQGVVNL